MLQTQIARYGQVVDALDGTLVATRFLSPGTREQLDAQGFSYADATGNVRLSISRPPFYVELRGADVNPWKEPRPLKTLGGASTAAVVRALLDFKPPYGVSDLAARAGLQVPTVSRVVSFLAEEALIIREARGPITLVKWQDLIRRWAQDYDLFRSNASLAAFEPRGVDAAVQKLDRLKGRWAITGSVATQVRVQTAPPALLAVYVEGSAQRALAEMDLRESIGTSNVVLLEPRSSLPFERSWEAAGLRYAALSQVAVDLLTGPGRSPSEAEMLLDWMAMNEDAWRSS
jgi:hypothetical protein